MAEDLSPLDRWRQATTARIALERAGNALATAPMLDFRAAHARARDAVYSDLDVPALVTALTPATAIEVHSEAPDRTTYLARPDFGRRLDPGCFARLPTGPFDIALICADGLSATGVQQQAPAFVAALIRLLSDLSFGPIAIARQARVAIGDDIGEAMHAALSIILIGERPGLSVPDSMGAYLTFGPRRGLRDSERNCISNIHGAGLSAQAAATKAAWLIRAALMRGHTGVALKDEQPLDDALSPSAPPPRLPVPPR